jgi:sulfite reductase (ferredoxin)
MGWLSGRCPQANSETVDRLTSRYLAERVNSETWPVDQTHRQATSKAMLDDLMTCRRTAPIHRCASTGLTPANTIGDMGVGECAGEVVSPLEFALAASEREAFEAQLALETGDRAKAARGAYEAMLHCAEALVKQVTPSIAEAPDALVEKFREHFYDTQLFFDPFAGGKFAQYFFFAHEGRDTPRAAERAEQLVEEAQLFIEAAHACHARLLKAQVAVSA